MKAVLFVLLFFLAACQEPIRETPPLLMDTTLAFPTTRQRLRPSSSPHSTTISPPNSVPPYPNNTLAGMPNSR